ncbi:YhcN/YlaJ family sporulation lipoprotein [Bacillus niameyensis]|uniref:YhcN/YlaJ family sporulation lipoprotein n=1 Tax=Bacillus niameyensis TaxID=1522308 RepID=UPI00078182F6|nr:YhcN/YlaJ family sporulation lipoprotein [Bacillus niameyensis]
MRIFIMAIFIILLSACNNQNNVNPNMNDSDVLPQGVSVKNSHIDTNDKNDYSDEERAQHLANLASDIPNVNGATAVVVGNMAVVGIDIDANVERSQVGTIKYSVSESLKHDPHGAGAIVVADPDLNARLKEVQDDMQSGKPIRGIMNELADIVGRIIPDLPPPEGGATPEDSVQDSKDQMNNQNEQDLNQKQKEHSNTDKQ